MGLFDEIAGAVEGAIGGQGGQAQGAAGIVDGLLHQGAGGPSSSIITSLLGAVMGGGQSGTPAQGGGLAGILETLAANGLAQHVATWVSNNPNLPVSAQQIHDALGSAQVQQMAGSAGLPVTEFLNQLVQHLPAAASEAAGTTAPAAPPAATA